MYIYPANCPLTFNDDPLEAGRKGSSRHLTFISSLKNLYQKMQCPVPFMLWPGISIRLSHSSKGPFTDHSAFCSRGPCQHPRPQNVDFVFTRAHQRTWSSIIINTYSYWKIGSKMLHSKNVISFCTRVEDFRFCCSILARLQAATSISSSFSFTWT